PNSTKPLGQQRAQNDEQRAETCRGSSPAQSHHDKAPAFALSKSRLIQDHPLSPSLYFEAQQHQASQRQHSEGDEEQDQSECNQRSRVKVADRFREFI